MVRDGGDAVCGDGVVRVGGRGGRARQLGRGECSGREWGEECGGGGAGVGGETEREGGGTGGGTGVGEMGKKVGGGFWDVAMMGDVCGEERRYIRAWNLLCKVRRFVLMYLYMLGS